MTKRVVLLGTMLLLLPCLAFAGSVTYSTSGSVTTPGTGLTYNAVTTTTVTAPTTTAPLGSFSFNCTAMGSCLSTGANLSITISQTMPGVGTAPLTATLTGIVLSSTNGLITINWSGSQTIVAGGHVTTYTPETTTVCTPTVANCSPNLYVGIKVPEPNAQLLLGIGSLGLFGLAGVSRKMINT